MSSIDSRAVWNPAFMPNSATDRHAGLVSHTTTTGSEKPTQDVPTERNVIDASKAPSHPDNSDHPELETLRNALTTSLASPGGVEMEENPLHRDGAVHRETNTEDYGGSVHNNTTQFSAERPAHEYGHSSSLSFARTVPRDVDWGEDDEVDPEWNLQATERETLNSMNSLDRTNSFPAVPPLHNPADITFDHQLPKSHAEDVFNKVVHGQNLFGEDNINEDYFGQAGETDRAADYGYDKSYGGDATDELDTDVRYEEGLPLMAHDEISEAPAKSDLAPKTSLFDDHALAEENDFFGNLASDDDNQAPPAPERKSTLQVLDSMDFHLKQSRPSTDLGLQDKDQSQSSLEKAMGGGLAASRSTILSQVLSDPNLPKPPTAEDLVAKWREALEGDELLDDDELLDEADPTHSSIDPASLFVDDDEGFLEDEDGEVNGLGLFPQTSSMAMARNDSQSDGFDSLKSGARSQQVTSNSRYLPPGAPQTTQRPTQASQNSYIPASPLFADLSTQSGSSPFQYNTGFHPPTVPLTRPNATVNQQQQPGLPKAQSFVDQSKGGYASPYDLPMEVVKPRKRVSAQPLNRGSSNPPPGAVPPPRSSSINTQGPPPSRGSTSSLSPPMLSSGFNQTSSKVLQVGPSAQKPKGGFFEELPVPPRPKPAGRYTSQPSPTISGDQATFAGPSPYQARAPIVAPQALSVMPQPSLPAHGLVAPPKASPYALLGTGPAPPPVATSRYSPAPSRSSSGGTSPPPLGQNRHATAPPPQNQPLSSHPGPTAPATVPPPPTLPHQPRTSSPLVHFEIAHDGQSSINHGSVMMDHVRLRRESSSYERTTRIPSLPMTQELDEQTGLPSSTNPSLALREHFPSSLTGLKRTTASYVSDHRVSHRHHEPSFKPPKRSQTQSPSKFKTLDVGISENYQRPMSAHSQIVPRYTSEQLTTTSAEAPKTRIRGLSQGMNYIAPTDGREHDPLQRWRGGPVFTWGVGGTIITSFPKEVPRYGVSQTMPMVICSPGEVKVRNLKDIYPLEERLAYFPGPLKGKSKKKEVLTWLAAGIDILEKENAHLRAQQFLSHDDKRKEERVLLWKILRLMIEHDGILEGNPIVNQAVRSVLTPGLDLQDSLAHTPFTVGADMSSITHPSTSIIVPEPVDAAAVDELRKHLLRGDREKAVWEAVDKRLWAHAMLISNTVSRDLYKKVAQEFIQKEVKNIGENTESLAAVYEIFAGNFEESIDELVPPSARAGLQMVSTQGSSGPAKGSIDGLDRWRETLGLVLSNRSVDDSQAITALGKLLSGYGRAEAAHICFLFARPNSIFSGVDDPYSNIVLIGSDHLRQPYEFEKELESILLSEVYEYGLSLSATSNVTFSAPHLAVYKLQHATILAQSGQREKALQYCEAIASSITSQVRRSPYHHALLLSALDDLSKRLKQSPKDGSSSWISKPSIDKVSGSVWAKFNKFVAGDENDAASGHGSDAGADIGPFARIAGDTPTISRSPSQGDIYGSFSAAPLSGGLPQLPSLKPTSRYAPGGLYTPPGAQDSAMSTSFGSPPHGSFTQRLSLEREDSANAAFGQQADPLPRSFQEKPIAAPYGEVQYGGPPYAPQLSADDSDRYISPISSKRPHLEQVSEEGPSMMDYVPPESTGYTAPTDKGYAASSSGGYEPPSYEPVTMNDEPDSPVDTKPKKKSFMDDDDDDFKPPLTSGKPAAEKSKAEKDREAEEAFRRAAEADAKKDAPAASSKKSWGLGGWFGKKDPAPDAAQPNKPIKAKLGEESSFVYDPELKRWVNKKAGKDGTLEASSTMPPPPKGPPRTASRSPPPSRSGPPPLRSEPAPPAQTMMPPPTRTASGPPNMETTSAPRPIAGSVPAQRAVSAYSTSPLAHSPGSGSLRPFGAPMTRTISNGSAASGPPSRPTTSQSNASSIDDLLGPPMLRKGPKKPKKGRGYVDVMGEKGSA